MKSTSLVTGPQQAMTGEQAYEADRAQLPLYHNGTPRPCWADLPDYAQWSWNRNPPRPARRSESDERP